MRAVILRTSSLVPMDAVVILQNYFAGRFSRI
jgi:hypothetical protein